MVTNGVVDDAAALADELATAGVVGVTIAWIDNNGIPRSRTVPIARLTDVARRGVGITSLFAVFDSHDGITFAHAGLSNASGDIRLVPVLSQLTRLAGQPAFAWAPGRQLTSDGSPSPYDQRAAVRLRAGVLRRQGHRGPHAGTPRPGL
jgi:glutamine synthetase